MNTPAPGSLWAACCVGGFLVVSTAMVTTDRMFDSYVPWMVPLGVLLLIALLIGARRHRMEWPPRLTLTTTASFLLLLGYAAVSALVTEQRIGGVDAPIVTLSKFWTLTVLAQSLLVCLAAFVAVALVRARDLPTMLWVFAIAGAVVTPIGWLINPTESLRLATNVGGAAVLHVALLIGLAISMAAWRSGRRPIVSFSATLLYALYITLSRSRAGLIELAVFAALAFGPSLLRLVRSKGLTRGVLLAAGGVLLVAGVMVASVLGRQRSDPTGGGRLDAWLDGWEALTSSVGHFVFGSGYGTMWPWMAFEVGNMQPEEGPYKVMPHGVTLGHAHNMYVSVGAELGVVGLLLFAPLVIAVLWCYRVAPTKLGKLLGAALAATLVGFAFDSYLMKNFPLSLIWWCAFFALVRLALRGRVEPAG